MAGKPRVHELARELGVESKVVLAKLKDLGEFVKSASSTVEPPVARKLREAFPANGAGGGAPASGMTAPRPGPRPGPAARPGPGAGAPRPGGGVPTPGPTATPAPTPAAPRPGPAPARPEPALAPAAEAPAAPAPTSMPARPGPAPAPRPAAAGPRPGPATPRPGNNPFSTPGSGGGAPPTMPGRPGAPRPGARPGAPAAGRPGATPAMPPRPAGAPGLPPRPGAPRPGAPRPGGAVPGMPPRPGSAPGMPPRPGGPRPGPGAGGPGGPRPAPGGPRPGPGGPRPSPGMFPQRAAGPRPGPGAARPGGPGPGARPGAPGRPGGFGGPRPGGGPGAGGGAGAGAPGRPGGGGGFAGRPGGRGRPGGGGTQGAFGRPGAPRGKQRKSKRAKRAEFDNLQAPSMESGAPRGNGELVRLPRGASLADFADRINANPGSLVQVLFGLGEMVTATQSCTDETLQLLGVQLNYDVQIVSPEDEDRELLERFNLEFGGEYDDDADLVARPPVVTVMGHVDHGKTKLLDAIRSANVVATESGGITQHIGAYQVRTTTSEGDERPITFIDTPGHEAFTAMRARGAKVTDIAVLVVAADDGVKPQTIEALNHAQAADVPIVVAVNKVDKEGADPSKVRGQLTEYGLVAEEYGGDTMFVDVSALQRQGIEDLLEAILLTADASLQLEADPEAPAQGVAIEGHLDRGRGPVATVLVQRGTLHVGDSVVAGDAFGRVRAMLDDKGRPVAEAGPASPVQVLGFTSVPGAGDNFLVVPEDRMARQIAEQRQARERNAELAMSRGRPTLETLFEKIKEGEKTQLNLILKGDVSGSVEAVEDALLKIDVGEEVGLRIIHRGVGAITETDVTLAAASDAVILGFNVRPEGRASTLADREHVDIRYYSVIYAAIEDIEAALKGMLKPEYEEVALGTAEVREVFRVPKIGNVAGSLVRTGIIRRNSKARLVRDGLVVADNLTVESLRRFKDDVTEVRDGYECGIGLGSYNDIKTDDVIETFEMREKPRA